MRERGEVRRESEGGGGGGGGGGGERVMQKYLGS